jgi:outer membrane lipoprotein-sorting protein
MEMFTRRPALRWIAPVALALAVAGTGIVASTADADPKLPPRTAEQLLVDLQSFEVDGLSGTVLQKAELGLPALPSMGGGADASQLTSLLSGNHTLRVWYDGPDKARFALLDNALGETNVIRNGTDLWTWSSHDNEATHLTLPEPSTGDRPSTSEVPITPQEAAREVLDAIGPSTVVSTDSAVEVADRPARELVLDPTDDRSLIGQVRVAVDDETSAPLRVQVLGVNGQTVAEVGFTDVEFGTPEARRFEFNPPPGAKVTDKGAVEPPADLTEAEREQARKAAEEIKARTEVIGEGWTTVVVTEVPEDAESGQLDAVLASLPTESGDWGTGKVLSGTAFSAVLTDDGRLAVGAVRPQVLYDALAK